MTRADEEIQKQSDESLNIALITQPDNKSDSHYDPYQALRFRDFRLLFIGTFIATIGEQMINNILINTVVPVLFAYGQHHNEQTYKDKAINWLEEISAEKNNITKGFEVLNLSHKSSFDSQSFIELKNEYCNKKERKITK